MYRFERNKLAYLDYDDIFFNNDKCDFKIKILIGM